jgi:hypothetical protein
MSTDLGAQEVLREMVARYRSMTSYSDSGEVTTTGRSNTAGLPRVTFATLFKRPAYFRFSFERAHAYEPLGHLATQHVAGSDRARGGYFTQKAYDGHVSEKTPIKLELAIARATGISRGSAHTIGRLLLPEVGGRSLLNSLESQRTADVEVDGTPCYAIKTRGSRGDHEEELWIEMGSFLLRKLFSRHEERESVESRERITVDMPLEDSLFDRPNAGR